MTFRYKDYRRNGADRQQVMTLAPNEFIRRFLLHTLPRGFHRIRHYGLLASSSRKDALALARDLLEVAPPPEEPAAVEPADQRPSCPCCGGIMVILETFAPWCQVHRRRHQRQTGRMPMTRHEPLSVQTTIHRRGLLKIVRLSMAGPSWHPFWATSAPASALSSAF